MQQDRLGRGPFIELLSNIITQKTDAHEGISFAIDGKWGCGKSWILKELEQKLESRNYFVIHYNYWENEYYEEPLVALLSVIVDKLNLIAPKIQGKRIQQKLKITAIFLAKSANIIAKSNIGVDFNELSKAGKEAINEEQKKFLDKKFDSNHLIKKTLETVRDYLLQLKSVLTTSGFTDIVIIVDELDRCLPEYAIKVMQRLHHICFDTVSDKYTFIQLAAINKSELLGSIAKTFGREFNLKQKYTPTNGNSPGTIFYENFDECQIQFGNYYFKKFFQMIIPVSNGDQIDNPLSLLEGFDEKFDPSDTNGREYVERFFTEVLSFFPMRSKLELIHLAKTAHEITALDSSLDMHLRYNTLCIELIDCLCKSVLKKGLPLIKHHGNQDQSHKLYLQIPDLPHIEGISSTIEFEQSFAKWSASDCYERRYRFEGNTNFTKVYEFELLTPESYIKPFYHAQRGLETKNIGKNTLESEEAFIKAFRKTLDALV